MNNSKKAAFAFFVSAALFNGKCALYNTVHAAGMVPNPSGSSYNSQNIFTKYGYKGQCTWFTYGRVLEKLGISLPSEFYGNAVDWWYSNAKDNVYSYGSEPKPNSIVVWGGGRVGYGHVGFVEKVEGNTVYFNEGNFSVRGAYDGEVKAISKDAIKNRGNLYLKGYIYLDGGQAKPSTPEVDVPTTSEKQPVIKTGVVSLSSSNSALNVRKGTNTSSGIIGSLRNGEKVNIVGTSGDWYKIEFNSSYAYISSKYVNCNSSNNSSTEKPSTPTENTDNSSNESSLNKVGFVALSNKGSSLNLRSNPSGSVISSLSHGTKLTILSSNNGWYKISANGTTGYVSSKYVSLSSSEANNSNNTTAESSNKTTETVSPGKVGVVNLSNKSSALNLRNTPWTGKVLSSLSYGSKIEVLDTNGRWYKVKANGIIGYVHSDYVTF